MFILPHSQASLLANCSQILYIFNKLQKFSLCDFIPKKTTHFSHQFLKSRISNTAKFGEINELHIKFQVYPQ